MTNSIPERVPQKLTLVPRRWEILSVLWWPSTSHRYFPDWFVSVGRVSLGGLRWYMSVGGGPVAGLSAACVLGGPGPGDQRAGHRAKIRWSLYLGLGFNSPRDRKL